MLLSLDIVHVDIICIWDMDILIIIYFNFWYKGYNFISDGALALKPLVLILKYTFFSWLHSHVDCLGLEMEGRIWRHYIVSRTSTWCISRLVSWGWILNFFLIKNDFIVEKLLMLYINHFHRRRRRRHHHNNNNLLNMRIWFSEILKTVRPVLK